MLYPRVACLPASPRPPRVSLAAPSCSSSYRHTTTPACLSLSLYRRLKPNRGGIVNNSAVSNVSLRIGSARAERSGCEARERFVFSVQRVGSAIFVRGTYIRFFLIFILFFIIFRSIQLFRGDLLFFGCASLGDNSIYSRHRASLPSANDAFSNHFSPAPRLAGAPYSFVPRQTGGNLGETLTRGRGTRVGVAII